MNHVWGLMAHPGREMRMIRQERETLSHHYAHHVLLMAAIPVISAFIGTTLHGFKLDQGRAILISPVSALMLAVLFYGLILAGVAVMGRVIHALTRHDAPRPTVESCTIFAGYVATPLFISGLVALYPLLWLCALVLAMGLLYSGWLLYVGMPFFLNRDREESLRIFGSTMAIGVLVFEVVLALSVVLWGYGSHLF